MTDKTYPLLPIDNGSPVSPYVTQEDEDYTERVWTSGYKAAGGYTEEDIRKALRQGEINEGCTACRKTDDEFLQSLKKHPKAVVLECDYSGKCKKERCLIHPCDGKCYVPKIVEG